MIETLIIHPTKRDWLSHQNKTGIKLTISCISPKYKAASLPKQTPRQTDSIHHINLIKKGHAILFKNCRRHSTIISVSQQLILAPNDGVASKPRRYRMWQRLNLYRHILASFLFKYCVLIDCGRTHVVLFVICMPQCSGDSNVIVIDLITLFVGCRKLCKQRSALFIFFKWIFRDVFRLSKA